MALTHVIFGRRFGDYNPRHLEPQALGRAAEQGMGMETQLWANPPTLAFVPTAGFTNHVAFLGRDDDRITDRFIRTKSPADAGIVEGERVAVGSLNGDCPFICLWEGTRLAGLHGGFRCLIRQDNEEPNLIEATIVRFHPGQTFAWIGGGIGPCCWMPEYESKPELRDPSTSRHPALLSACLTRTTPRSPFGSGHLSVDLYALAAGLLQEVGVPADHITIDGRCTCCAGGPRNYAYWSFTRYRKESGTDGRNLSLAWLDSEVDRALERAL